MLIKDETTLYYKAGSSDKVYYVAICEHTSGQYAGDFSVEFAYGRRLGTLQTGTKTETPTAYSYAQSVYDDIVYAKTRKGYKKGKDLTPCPINGISTAATVRSQPRTVTAPQPFVSTLRELSSFETDRILFDNGESAQGYKAIECAVGELAKDVGGIFDALLNEGFVYNKCRCWLNKEKKSIRGMLHVQCLNGVQEKIGPVIEQASGGTLKYIGNSLWSGFIEFEVDDL